jgi:transglutaminase-like putative cysteine protease
LQKRIGQPVRMRSRSHLRHLPFLLTTDASFSSQPPLLLHSEYTGHICLFTKSPQRGLKPNLLRLEGNQMEKIEKEDYLSPDFIIDSDNERVKAYAAKVVGDPAGPLESAVKLYYAVRDNILYDPYTVSRFPEAYRASATLERGRGFCVQKAALLCALGRACRIPSRLGFATVKNHLASKQLLELVGSNLFVFHGYTELLLNGKWIKATPAFNETLCMKYHVAPLAFNGHEDSIFQAYTSDQKLFMEYTEYFGTFSSVPMKIMMRTWQDVYGNERLEKWFRHSENSNNAPGRDFYKETPLVK